MNTDNDIVFGDPPEEEEEPPTPTTLLDNFLEREGIITVLRQRVANLEQFRDQYMQLSASSDVPVAHPPSEPSLSPPTSSQAESNFQAELEQIEAQSQSTINEQTATIGKLESQIRELNGCQQVLESELDRLAQENEELKSKEPEVVKVIKEVQAESAPTTTEPTEDTSKNEEDSKLVSELRAEVSQAMDMAFGAMRSNADLGGIIHLLTQSFECSTLEALGNLVIDSINNYNLQGTICFPIGGKKEYFSTSDEVSKEDKLLIEQMTEAEPFTETETHLSFYTHYCQLLIARFDTDDFKAFNDLKDTLRMLSTGVNAGARRVVFEIAATKERANLERLVMTTQKNLKNIDAKQRKEVSQVSAMATETITGVKSQLAKLPADQDKKNNLVNFISQELLKIEKIVKEASFVDEGFKKVIAALTASLAKQKQGS